MLRQLVCKGFIRRLTFATIDNVRSYENLSILICSVFDFQPHPTAQGPFLFSSQSPFVIPRAEEPLVTLPYLVASSHLLQQQQVRRFAAAQALAEDDAPNLPLPQREHLEQGLERDIEVPLFDLNKKEIGKYVLAGDVFDVPIRTDILHRVVRWQLARRQQGTHKTLTRSEVRGGGAKPWQQKGSGRARQGTIRAPQWRGGGVVHGPVPRSHEHSLFKRLRRLGLKCALSAKAWERRLIVVDSLGPVDSKTKTMDGHIGALLEGASRRSALLVDSDKEGLDGG